LKLSIIIPVYNEASTLREILRRVRAVTVAVPVGFTVDDDNGQRVQIEKEIIVVDDGSVDGSRQILEEEAAGGDVRAFYHEHNQGKGAAVRTGFENATGDFFVIQDADLEYDPREYRLLLQPILEDRADVVYGSRFRGGPTKTMFFTHMLGNRFLTLVTNILYDTILSDMETSSAGTGSTRCLFRIPGVNSKRGRRSTPGAMVSKPSGPCLSIVLLIDIVHLQI
jgi:glycosyltransferase involved in cell wall biosynthesis